MVALTGLLSAHVFTRPYVDSQIDVLDFCSILGSMLYCLVSPCLLYPHGLFCLVCAIHIAPNPCLLYPYRHYLYCLVRPCLSYPYRHYHSTACPVLARAARIRVRVACYLAWY